MNLDYGSFKDKVLDLLTNGNIQEALNESLSLLKDLIQDKNIQSFYNDVILISSKFRYADKLYIIGTISLGDYLMNRAQITKSLISIINSIDEKLVTDSKITGKTNFEKFFNKKYTIEIKLNQSINDFSLYEQRYFFSRINNLLADGETIVLTSVMPGSIIYNFTASEKGKLKLQRYSNSLLFEDVKIISFRAKRNNFHLSDDSIEKDTILKNKIESIENEVLNERNHLYNYIFFHLLDENESNELLKKVYQEALSILDKFESYNMSIRGWLIMIARNRISKIKIDGKEKKIRLKALTKTNSNHELLMSVEGLEYDIKDTLILSDISKIKLTEIAEIHDVNLNIIKNRLRRGRMKVIKNLSDQGKINYVNMVSLN